MLPALLSQLCSMSLCQPVKPEGTLWVNQRQSSANTPSGRGPAEGAKVSRERGKGRMWVGESEDGSESKMTKETQNHNKHKPGLRVFEWKRKYSFCYKKRGSDLFVFSPPDCVLFLCVCWRSRATSSQWSPSSLSEESTHPVPFKASRGHCSSTDWAERGHQWVWKLRDRQLQFICSWVTTLLSQASLNVWN